MGFVNYKEKAVRRFAIQPFSGTIPDFSLYWTQEHILQHGVVCNQNIRTKLLHFKACHEFRIFQIRNMFSLMQTLQELFHIRFRGNFSFGEQFLKVCPFRLHFSRRKCHSAQSAFQHPILPGIRLFTRIRRSACIHAKLRPATVRTTHCAKNLCEISFPVSNQLSQAGNLIGDKGIHGIQYNSTNAPHVPSLWRIMCLCCQLRKQRPQKTLCFSRTGSG